MEDSNGIVQAYSDQLRAIWSVSKKGRSRSVCSRFSSSAAGGYFEAYELDGREVELPFSGCDSLCAAQIGDV